MFILIYISNTKMQVEIEGVPLIVSQDGSIQKYVTTTVENGVPLTIYGFRKEEGIMDVDGSLKLSINNRYYKFQDIMAMVYMDYDPRDKNRVVTHINHDTTDNRIDNICIENLSIKRKFERMSI